MTGDRYWLAICRGCEWASVSVVTAECFKVKGAAADVQRVIEMRNAAMRLQHEEERPSCGRELAIFDLQAAPMCANGHRHVDLGYGVADLPCPACTPGYRYLAIRHGRKAHGLFGPHARIQETIFRRQAVANAGERVWMWIKQEQRVAA